MCILPEFVLNPLHKNICGIWKVSVDIHTCIWNIVSLKWPLACDVDGSTDGVDALAHSVRCSLSGCEVIIIGLWFEGFFGLKILEGVGALLIVLPRHFCTGSSPPSSSSLITYLILPKSINLWLKASKTNLLLLYWRNGNEAIDCFIKHNGLASCFFFCNIVQVNLCSIIVLLGMSFSWLRFDADAVFHWLCASINKPIPSVFCCHCHLTRKHPYVQYTYMTCSMIDKQWIIETLKTF